MARPSRGKRGERATPFVYLGCTFALVAFAIPSVLRPPPDQATTSAEFSPDAPPEDEADAIISALQQAGSSGAGADLNTTTTTTTPPIFKPVRGRCFGDPPRQSESVYAPPCKEAFVGDNGGSTTKGVSKDEIRIATIHDLTGTTVYEGCIPDGAPRPDETANERTWRVLQEYFNTRFEFSGRKIKFCFVHGDGNADGDTDQRIRAQKADEVYDVFGAIHETAPASAFELARRKIVTFTLAQFPGEVYVQHAPYLWNFGPDQTRLIDMGAEYLCKKLANKPVKWSDDARFQDGRPRKFGLISYNDSGYTGGPDYFQQLIRERCGVELGNNIIRYDLSAGADPTVQLSSAMTQFSAAQVTTIIYMGDLISAAIFTPAATQNAYFPEWYIPGFGGVDVDDFLARSAYDQRQWKNAFGFSAYEIPVADPARECEIAYRSIDPDNSPDDGMCTYFWQQMVKMMGAIQEAGPNLTPETFKEALFRLPKDPPNPAWRMAGGYGENDYTYVDWYTELWWNPDAIHPNGDTGAYCYIRGGKRYTYGQFQVEDPPVFDPNDCMTTRPAE